MDQDGYSPPCTTISVQLEVVRGFVYLDSTISDLLSLDTELNRRTGKVATTFFRLIKRVWLSMNLTEHTKI